MYNYTNTRPTYLECFVKFVIKFLPPNAGTPFTRACRISSLEHEVFDISEMEDKTDTILDCSHIKGIIYDYTYNNICVI